MPNPNCPEGGGFTGNFVIKYNEVLELHNDTKLKEWEAEAARMTAESFASAPVGSKVKIYTSNSDGTFSSTETDYYSALHWGMQLDITQSNIAVVQNISELELVDTNQTTIAIVSNPLLGGVFVFEDGKWGRFGNYCPPLNKIQKINSFDVGYIAKHESGKSTYPQGISIDKENNHLYVFGYTNAIAGEKIDIHIYAIDTGELLEVLNVPNVDTNGDNVEFMYAEGAVISPDKNRFVFTAKKDDIRGIAIYNKIENSVLFYDLGIKTFSLIIPDIDGQVFGVEEYDSSNDFRLNLKFYDTKKLFNSNEIKEVFTVTLQDLPKEKIQSAMYARGKIYLGLGETKGGIAIYNIDGTLDDIMLFSANDLNAILDANGETENEGLFLVEENGIVCPYLFFESYGAVYQRDFSLIKLRAHDGVSIKTIAPVKNGAGTGEKLLIATEQFSLEGKNVNPPADNISDIFRYMVENRVSNLSIYIGGYEFYWDKLNNEKVKAYSTIYFTANNYYTLIAHAYSYSGAEQIVRYTCTIDNYSVKKEVLLPLPFAHINIAEHTTAENTQEVVPLSGFYRNSGEFEIINNKVRFLQGGIYEIDVVINHTKGNDTQDHTSIKIYTENNDLIGAGDVVNTDIWYPACAYTTHEFQANDEVWLEETGRNDSGVWNKFIIRKI